MECLAVLQLGGDLCVCFGSCFALLELCLVQESSLLMKSGNQDMMNPLLGDILVVVAQLAAASQFIVEEKYLAKYRCDAARSGNLATVRVTRSTEQLFQMYRCMNSCTFFFWGGYFNLEPWLCGLGC